MCSSCSLHADACCRCRLLQGSAEPSAERDCTWYTLSAISVFSARLQASMSAANVRALGLQEDVCMSSSTWKARCSCPARPASVIRPFHIGASGCSLLSCADSQMEVANNGCDKCLLSR